MSDLSAFPVAQRWPAKDPSVIQLYAFPTPNGVKASIMLEETGLPYEAHRVTLKDEDVKSPAFVSLSANGKIPAILDPNGPDGAPIGLFESGAILLYLAEKSGKFLGETARDKYEITQWLMWQMGGVGPMFGQLGFFFAFAGKDIEDPRPRTRYVTEARRLLSVLETRLQGRDWICGNYSIADMAIAPWLTALDFYGVTEVVGLEDHAAVTAYRDRFLDRPCVVRARNIPPREG